MTQSLQEVAVGSEQIEASKIFGRMVHRCAVRAKGKSVLAKKAGLVLPSEDKAEAARRLEEGREVIKRITGGEGHLLDPAIIASVASASSEFVAKEEIPYMEDLLVCMTRRQNVEKPGRLPNRERN